MRFPRSTTLEFVALSKETAKRRVNADVQIGLYMPPTLAALLNATIDALDEEPSATSARLRDGKVRVIRVRAKWGWRTTSTNVDVIEVVGL